MRNRLREFLIATSQQGCSENRNGGKYEQAINVSLFIQQFVLQAAQIAFIAELNKFSPRFLRH